VRADVLTPLAKAWATDVGCEVASLGIQVHGGMGFIEETGAAQHWRDARIAPIYEGTNGIQAADLVGRKLGLDGGAAFDLLIADIRAETADPRIMALADAVEVAAATYRSASQDDRMAGSYPFLTMCSVLVASWLLERQANIVGDSDFHAAKRAAANYFNSVVVPGALGLAAGAEAGTAMLYAVSAEAALARSAFRSSSASMPRRFMRSRMAGHSWRTNVARSDSRRRARAPAATNMPTPRLTTISPSS
jgi:hypothetical protein